MFKQTSSVCESAEDETFYFSRTSPSKLIDTEQINQWNVLMGQNCFIVDLI